MALTLESSAIIRVGAPDAPYAVAVVRSRQGLSSGRLSAEDLENLPPIGSEVVEITRNAQGAAVYAAVSSQETPA
ncbi:hypothetical protein [Rhodococcus gordoniae]